LIYVNAAPLEETMAEALEVEMSAFLDEYNEAFATYDGDQIAKLYCVPTITMRGEGGDTLLSVT
jgi:hypothetical protein